jgi:hypothetical protein
MVNLPLRPSLEGSRKTSHDDGVVSRMLSEKRASELPSAIRKEVSFEERSFPTCLEIQTVRPAEALNNATSAIAVPHDTSHISRTYDYSIVQRFLLTTSD